MPRTRHKEEKPAAAEGRPSALSLGQSAQYTYEMLISLKKLPAIHDERQLMRLIDAAAAEARALAKRESV